MQYLLAAGRFIQLIRVEAPAVTKDVLAVNLVGLRK